MLAGLAACGAETEKPSDTTPPDPSGTVTDAPASDTEDEPDKGPSVAEILPKLDFDGALVTIAMDYVGGDYPPPEELTGSAVNDAIVDRTRAVEEQYGVKLEYFVHSLEPREQYVMWAQSGDDTYKLYTSRSRYVVDFITKDVARSWSKYPDIIDFEAEWFDSYAINTFAVGDDARMLYGDANESGIRYAWIWLFNKELAEDYHLPDLYALVDEGKWTLDCLMTLTQDVYTDVNGNGVNDGEDVYGYVSDHAASFDSWGPTLGISPVRKDENNLPVVLDTLSERTIEGFDKLYKFFWESKGTLICEAGSGLSAMQDMFVQNKAIFHNTQIGGLENEQVRDMVDFGVLPTPKLTEDQDTYYTHTDCCFSCLLLPSVITEEEALCSVYVANALNAFSHELVRPVYYETVLKTRLTRDRESPRMMDLALAGRRYGFEYFGETHFPITHVYMLRNTYAAHRMPTVSMYTSKIDKYKQQVEDFLLDWQDMVDWENRS
jgi:hypothetical protein